MPRIIREIHEYYQNRIIKGLHVQVVSAVTPGDTLRIKLGSALIDMALVAVLADVDIPASSFIIPGNAQARVDIVTLKADGNVNVIHGTPGIITAPTCPAGELILAHVSFNPNWTHFVGHGVNDEVLCTRSQHVIDTRYTP